MAAIDLSKCSVLRLHASESVWANELADRLEKVGYTCRTRDKEGVTQLLVKGGVKKPRAIFEYLEDGEGHYVFLQHEFPLPAGMHGWEWGRLSDEDIPEFLQRVVDNIPRAIGESAWQRRMAEERAKESIDDVSW